jgi:translation initiation factor IF-1
MGNSEEQKGSNDHVDSNIRSILFSVFLVALAIAFVFGFKYILKGNLFTGPGSVSEADGENGQDDPNQINMEKDNYFKYEYIMVQGLDGKEIYASAEPGKTDANSVKLDEGDILKVNMRGHIGSKLYYQLDNDLYLKDNKSLMPLKEYVELKGYLSITYISSSGVHLRRWADFDADNIVGSVYVGDKVYVSGKVITATGTEAFVTKDGYYITADSHYLNDHTKVVQEKKK